MRARRRIERVKHTFLEESIFVELKVGERGREGDREKKMENRLNVSIVNSAWLQIIDSLECVIGMASDFLCKILPYSAHIRSSVSLPFSTYIYVCVCVHNHIFQPYIRNICIARTPSLTYAKIKRMSWGILFIDCYVIEQKNYEIIGPNATHVLQSSKRQKISRKKDKIVPKWKKDECSVLQNAPTARNMFS